MTIFRKIDLKKLGDEGTSKKTKFTKVVINSYDVEETNTSPSEYENVVHIGRDRVYGDVFIAYDDNPNNFTIFFGEAGDEFENNGE